MIFAWASLVAATVVVILAIPTARMISVAVWPGEAPLNLHDNRARDPHLRHLARILDSESSVEAQHTLAELRQGMITASMVALLEGEDAVRGRLGGAVAEFLDEPAPRDRTIFLRRLGAALEQIERL